MVLKFNRILLTALSATLVFAILIHWQSLWITKWYHWQPTITYLPLTLLVITTLFASQFNRSRLAILSLLWIVLSLTWQYHLPWSAWFNSHQDWLLLSVAASIVLVSFLQDRALLSLHSVYRLLMMAIIGFSLLLWLERGPSLLAQYLHAYVAKQSVHYVLMLVPLVFMSIILLARCFWQPTSIVLTIAVSFVVWCVQQLHWIALPWSLVWLMFAGYYGLVVMFDSYILAYRDELTSLPTRRALNNLALSLVRKYSVAMLDIDHFKKFNDTYGHDIGDQVLKLVAMQLKKIKGGGKVFRFGGEEFTVVFPGKDIQQALPELEKLRQSIADYGMVIRQPQRYSKKDRGKKLKTFEKTVSVTISIGVAMKQKGQSFSQTLKLADQALYRAKGKGRNNVSE